MEETRPVNFDVVDLARRERLKVLKLTDKERAFCESYVRHFDGMLAVKEAGYEGTDYEQGSFQASKAKQLFDMLMDREHVVEYIRLLKESVASRLDISIDTIVDEYKRLAFASMDDYVEWDKDGIVKMKSSKDLTRAQKAGILEITETSTKMGKQIKIKLYNKQSALDRLFEILKELEDREKRPEPAAKINQTQINLILRDPVMRRAIEYLAEGLYDHQIFLTTNDKDKAKFDQLLSKMTNNFLEVAHGGKGQRTIGYTPETEREGEGGKKGNGKNNDGSRKAAKVAIEEITEDEKGGFVTGDEEGESEEPESNRYDIDGL